MKKKINKPFRIFLKWLKYFCVLFILSVFIGITFLYFKLEKEPIDLGFILPKVESYITSSDNLKLSADSVVLSAKADRNGLFHIQIDNLLLQDRAKQKIIELPDIELSYGIWQLLTLNPVPKNVFVEKAYLYITLTKDGRFILEDQEDVIVQEETDLTNLKDKGNTLKKPVSVQNQTIVINDVVEFFRTFFKLRRFYLKDSSLVLNDLKENKKIVFPNLNVFVKRQRFFQYDISAGGQVVVDNQQPMSVNLEAQLKTRGKILHFNGNFDNLKLDSAGRAFELFKGFKVVLKGTVDGEIEFVRVGDTLRKSINKLSFAVETMDGTKSVYLPHPLDITYPIKSIKAEGVFGDNLDQLFIRPVKVVLKSGLTADVDIVINGIGTYLDSKDMTDIHTTIQARLVDVPMQEVPNVWPSYLGTTAHTWVKENLVGGMAPTALFTLYFTGGEITDLLGDVDFKDVDVHYLRPLPPVQKAGGKVMLYPDKVEIFANQGMLGNVKLDVGNVYLTELLDDVSNAKIELSVVGPLNEMLEVINQKPLDLLSSFHIEPSSTAGQASGQVFLNFPLIDDLKPKDVQVEVKSKIQQGVFKLPVDKMMIENGDFDLYVNNDGLKVEGKGDVLTSKLNIKWEEFFEVTEKQPVQSIYSISGVINDQLITPYYKDFSSFVSGDFKTNTIIKKLKDKPYKIDASFDLKTAQVQIHPLSYQKGINVKGDLRTSFNASQNGITDILFDYHADNNTSLKGSLDLKSAGFSLFLDKVQTPDSFVIGSIEYYAKEFIKVNLKGSSLNLSGLKDFPPLKNAQPNLKAEQKMTPFGAIDMAEIFFDVSLDTLTLKENMPLKQVSFKAYRNGSLWQNLFLFAVAAEPVSINYTPQKGRLDAASNNVGDLLNRLGFSDQFEKGTAKIEAKVLPNGGFSGEVILKNINLKEPGFVMQAVTILGIWDAISGNDLSFSNGSIPFDLSPNFTFFIKDGVLYGTVLGITFEGRITPSFINLTGSVIPAYIINSLPGRIPVIGHLFKDSEGGGLVGVKYEVNGTPANPKVNFNPLSSIAPGILGRFFK